MKVSAETDGKSAKVRMYGRLCKQFEDAVKKHERGKPVDIDELPTPPGFPPLSTIAGTSTTSPPAAPTQESNVEQPAAEPIPEAEPSEETISPGRKAPAPPPRTKPGE